MVDVDTTLYEQQELRLQQETNQFLSIFPELVWHRIIENLDNNNKQCLINSSPFFRNLLHKKRTKIYFQDVIKVITSQCITTTSETKSFVLNCRMVCRSWNRAIEDLAENEEKCEISHSTKSLAQAFRSIKSLYNFDSMDKFADFIIKFKNCDGNPFFGRFIKFSSHIFFYWSAFYHGHVLPYLEQYGHNISSCTFHLKDAEQLESEVVFRNAVKTLYVMPNLKKFRIEYENPLKFVPNAILSAPMLPHLKTSEFSLVATPFCDAIIKENVHVTNLCFAMSSANLLYPFENLKDLELYQCTMEDVEKLKNYNGLMWPLNRLTLRFDVKVDWAELLDFLSEKCGRTLEELYLSTYHEETKKSEEDKIRTDCQIGRMNCPKLRKLKLCVANYSSFNFILGTAESLESLHIEWKLKKTKRRKKRFDYMTTEVDSEDVQILDYREDLYSSNIWRLFPKLNIVILEGYDMSNKQTYERKEWKKLNVK